MSQRIACVRVGKQICRTLISSSQRRVALVSIEAPCLSQHPNATAYHEGQLGLCHTGRLYHTSLFLREKGSKKSSTRGGETKDDTKSPLDPEEDDSVVPDWQNPLHHNNPEYNKIYTEDFDGEEMPIQPLPPFDDGSGKVLAPDHIHALAGEMAQLTMMEMAELVQRIGKHFDIPEDSGVGMMAGGDVVGGDGAASSEADAAVDERTAFDLKLVGFNAKAKIKVIKEVRSVAGLGLKEAKEMVEGAPIVFMKEIKMDQAEELKKKLEEVGAEVEIV